jgi:hypothetical protein
MKREMLLIYRIAACVLALAGLLYAFRPVSSVAAQNSANLAESSPWLDIRRLGNRPQYGSHVF